MRWGIRLTAALQLFGCVAAAQAGTQVQEVVFICARGVELPVSFITPDNDPGYAVMQVEGKLVTLRSIPTGSGVR